LFLSLLDEGKEGGGFDVSLTPVGIPFFLQFKLSEHIKTANSRETKAKIIFPPYYRFFLRILPQSPQHHMLFKLDDGKNIVRYVAPIFSTLEEFDHLYLTNSVLTNSVFVRPHKIGDFVDGERHTVSFKDRRAYHVLSEPRTEEEPTDDETLARVISGGIEERGAAALTAPALRELRQQLLSIIGEYGTTLLIVVSPDREPTSLLRDIGYLARVYFGAS